MAKAPYNYRPSKKVRERREERYGYVHDMFELKNKTFPEFADEWGERTLREYLDDSRRRVNGTPPTREELGKEDWQANVFPPETRTKLRSFISGMASRPPEFVYKAWNTAGIQSNPAAEVSRNLVRHSRMTKGHNMKKELFLEAWSLTTDGTVIKYDGWEHRETERDMPIKFDPLTGEVKTEKRTVVVADRAIDEKVPLEEFLIWDIRQHDIQKQTRVAWVQYKNEEEIKAEFEHYANYKYLKKMADVNHNFTSETDSYYYNEWGSRVEAHNTEFEVVRLYDKHSMSYCIYVNGVEMLDAPLIWGNEEPKYPFSKAIAEPFADTDFFYGKSLPSILESWQDASFTIWNLALDKLLRSMNAPMLIGMANRDLFDMEDEFVTMDNRYYVSDVNNVKPLPYPQMNTGDMSMLQGITGQIDRHAIGVTQSGGQTGNTAREVLLADQRAQELKGAFYIFLEDLWMQKERLRLNTVMLHYMQASTNKVVGATKGNAFKERMRIFDVPETKLPDNSTGTLGIHVANSAEKRLSRHEIEDRENAAKEQGINYKLVSITYSYLDDWELDFAIVPESLIDVPLSKREARVLNKQQNIATLFPDYFVANRERFFREMIEVYGEQAEEYEQPPQQQPQTAGGEGGTIDPLDEAALAEESPIAV